MTVVVSIGGAVIGAVLGIAGAYLLYLKQRSDAAKAYRKQKTDAKSAYRQQQMDAEMSVRFGWGVLQHELCAAAKDWLRKLPNWGDARGDKERAVQRLDLERLVHAQHHRPLGRVEVEPDHVADLVDEQRVAAELNGSRVPRSAHGPHRR